MELDKLSLFSVIKRRLAWLGHRQEVLAQNIANSDTPRYKARDLKARRMSRAAMATSAPIPRMRFDSDDNLSLPHPAPSPVPPFSSSSST